MAVARLASVVSATVAASVIAAMLSTIPASAGGESGVVENSTDIAAAVGSGVINGAIVGFTATGVDNQAAKANVIAACQRVGAQQCTSDEDTDDRLCIVNVDHGETGVVAGGAGLTIEAARADALNRAAANNTPLDSTDPTLASSCP